MKSNTGESNSVIPEKVGRGLREVTPEGGVCIYIHPPAGVTESRRSDLCRSTSLRGAV
jgi:hypothetical protein